MKDFCENSLRILIQFLTSSNTESGAKNTAENWQWEDAGRKPQVQLLLAIKMIANYFGEKTDDFLTTAEVMLFSLLKMQPLHISCK